eukprot:145927-Hanusia_phi.AAC.1
MGSELIKGWVMDWVGRAVTSRSPRRFQVSSFQRTGWNRPGEHSERLSQIIPVSAGAASTALTSRRTTVHCPAAARRHSDGTVPYRRCRGRAPAALRTPTATVRPGRGPGGRAAAHCSDGAAPTDRTRRWYGARAVRTAGGRVRRRAVGCPARRRSDGFSVPGITDGSQ